MWTLLHCIEKHRSTQPRNAERNSPVSKSNPGQAQACKILHNNKGTRINILKKAALRALFPQPDLAGCDTLFVKPPQLHLPSCQRDAEFWKMHPEPPETILWELGTHLRTAAWNLNLCLGRDKNQHQKPTSTIFKNK